MDRIKKTFLGSAITCGAFAVIGVASMVIMREVSFVTAFPILGGAYFGMMTYFKYKESKSKQIMEYMVRLVSVEKGDELFAEDYHFETINDEATEIFISGSPTLSDDNGKKLKKGYLYSLVYLTSNGEVLDFNHPFIVTPIKGLTRSKWRDSDASAPKI